MTGFEPRTSGVGNEPQLPLVCWMFGGLQIVLDSNMLVP